MQVFNCFAKDQGKMCGELAGTRDCTNGAVHACEAPLYGRREGETCGRPICETHTSIGQDGVRRCPPHQRLRAKAEARKAGV